MSNKMNVESGAATTRSVGRALSILNAFDQHHNTLSFTDLRKTLGLPKATLFRLLNTLVQEDYLSCDKDGLYTLGPQIIFLGNIATVSLDLSQVVGPFMENLRDVTNQSITMYVRRGLSKICMMKQESRSEIRLTVTLGLPLPLYAGASGLVLMSGLSDEELNALLAQMPLEPITQNTITDPQRLKEVVSNVRRQGYYFSCGEREPNSAGIGAPIYNYFGEVVASLNISGVAAQFTADKIEEWSGILREAAAQASWCLGYRRKL